jgi:hypothetical protein
MPTPRRLLQACRSLLGSLVLLLVLFPVLTEMARPLLLIMAVAAVFVAGVAGVASGPRRVRTAAGLAAIQIVLTVIAAVLEEGSRPYLYTVSCVMAITAILIVYCISCVLRHVLQANYITRDQIYAGISVYLMLGFAFGSTYYLLGILNPGSFAVNNQLLAGNRGPDLMYFSFVTLATLGYGDITPVTKSARALAELEAIAGTLYMAVFMARLVSLHAGSSPTQSEGKPEGAADGIPAGAPAGGLAAPGKN